MPTRSGGVRRYRAGTRVLRGLMRRTSDSAKVAAGGCATAAPLTVATTIEPRGAWRRGGGLFGASFARPEGCRVGHAPSLRSGRGLRGPRAPTSVVTMTRGHARAGQRGRDPARRRGVGPLAGRVVATAVFAKLGQLIGRSARPQPARGDGHAPRTPCAVLWARAADPARRRGLTFVRAPCSRAAVRRAQSAPLIAAWVGWRAAGGYAPKQANATTRAGARDGTLRFRYRVAADAPPTMAAQAAHRGAAARVKHPSRRGNALLFKTSGVYAAGGRATITYSRKSPHAGTTQISAALADAMSPA